MALAFDAEANSGAKDSVSSVSYSHTCTGSNLILLVCCTVASANSFVVSTVKYNGVSLTLGKNENTTSGLNHTSIYYLVNPATGAHTVAVTYTGSIDAGAVTSISLTGAAQSSPIDATGSAEDTVGTGTTTANITTATANAWLIDSYFDNPGGALGSASVGSGQTSRSNIPDSVVGVVSGSSTKATTTVGAYSTTWTDTSSSPDGILSVVAIKPAVAVSFTWQQLTPAGQELPREFFDRAEVVDY